jgi:ABC-type dipeptide/oligopeptide/nickel transport system ATPase component
VKLEVLPGEILGLVGQSGSGKSTLAMALMGLLGSREASVHGRIVLAGQEVVGLNDRQMREIRGRLVSLIPQSPSAALNPALRIGTQLREAWIAHALGWPVEGRDRVRILLASSGLPGDADFLSRFPSQISIGQAQRILIVMALLHNPALLIADEPTSALDLVTQREVLDLLARINLERRMAILFISHDLLTVSTICHRLAILHEGVVVECGPAAEILSAPQHWYTRQLVAAIPKWSGLAGAP